MFCEHPCWQRGHDERKSLSFSHWIPIELVSCAGPKHTRCLSGYMGIHWVHFLFGNYGELAGLGTFGKMTNFTCLRIYALWTSTLAKSTRCGETCLVFPLNSYWILFLCWPTPPHPTETYVNQLIVQLINVLAITFTRHCQLLAKSQTLVENQSLATTAHTGIDELI